MNIMNKQVQEIQFSLRTNGMHVYCLEKTADERSKGTSFCIGGYGLFCFATTGNVSVVEAAHNSGLWYYKE